jgi:polysaccharide biosynthesis transport protein
MATGAENGMRFQDYWQIFRTHRYSIIALALLGAVISGYLALSAVPQYRATASVYFSLPASNSATDLNQGATYTQAQVVSYAALVTKPIVLAKVIDELELELTPKQLARSISARASGRTVLVDISAVSRDPQRASDLANSTATQLGVVVRELSPKGADGESAISVAIVAEATAPSVPFTPNTRRDVMIGFIGGLLVGSALALARELLDTKPRDADEVAGLVGAPVLAQVAHDNDIKRKIYASGQYPTRTTEAFQRLRTNLRYVSIERPANVVTITSALAGEGKSTTSINFARACAQAGDRVLLIDADLRSPVIATRLCLQPAYGLTNLLAEGVPFEHLVQSQDDMPLLDVLASGDVPPNPTHLIESPAMSSMLATARQTYDIVIIDSPPLLPVSDGAILARQSGAALLVANMRKVHRHQLVEAVSHLQQVGGDLVGVIVNGSPPDEAASYYGNASSSPGGWIRKLIRPRWYRQAGPRLPDDHTDQTRDPEPPVENIPAESETAEAVPATLSRPPWPFRKPGEIAEDDRADKSAGAKSRRQRSAGTDVAPGNR